ncbi:MAG: hypothetical protein GVY20_01455 [Bacteroidetes bacterium]|jgi:hypothetical protein|nr:hypothetical protein [Bacteroidota bacterium]
MKYQKPVTVLVLLITIMAGVASSMGIFSTGGPGPFEYESIRGEAVQIYGQGLYRHMSADVAPQGIAQDYVTLFIAIPFLWISLFWARTGSLRGRFLLAGTLGYFFVTYLFYLVMAMYNILFLLYAALLGISFFGLSLVMLSFDVNELPGQFSENTPVKLSGGFLILNTVAIAMLWLGVIIPPLLDGTIIPQQTEHYTTLIVQGLDLGLLLPLAFVSGVLFIQKKPMGYLLAPVYLGFLCILMAALVSKIIAMGLMGQNIIPVIFIIPAILFAVIICTVLVLRNIHE